ncbi:O-antigen ligase family protein [Pseudomonas prosekii]|uniref:O-antigen ligase family protein n=1 Tax=Pseudomonas prosekii TaxID=1148509 RepID=UPI003F74F489
MINNSQSPDGMSLDSPSYERQSLFVLLFLGSVFFGNIYGRFTLPLTIILLPLLVVYLRAVSFNFVFFLPVISCLSVIAQAVAGYPPQKADISVYFGFVYSTMIMVGLGRATLDDDRLRLGLIGGGLFIALVMVLTSASNFSSEIDFYAVKNLMVTPLGSSNYLAIFILFSFTVALFFSHYLISTVLAVAIFITFSRTGYIMLALTAIIWFVEMRLRPSATTRKYTFIVSMSVLAAVWFGLYINYDSLPLSLANRVELWRDAVGQVLEYPLFGTPRSTYLQIFHGLAWDPHNSVLNLLILVGLAGTAVYACFLFVVIKTFRELSFDSLIWKAVYYAVIVSLIWSLFEVILLTPAYDILLAVLFCFARGKKRELTNQRRTVGANSDHSSSISIESMDGGSVRTQL